MNYKLNLGLKLLDGFLSSIRKHPNEKEADKLMADAYFFL